MPCRARAAVLLAARTNRTTPPSCPSLLALVVVDDGDALVAEFVLFVYDLLAAFAGGIGRGGGFLAAESGHGFALDELAADTHGAVFAGNGGQIQTLVAEAQRRAEGFASRMDDEGREAALRPLGTDLSRHEQQSGHRQRGGQRKNARENGISLAHVRQ